jgi:xylose isomerase
MKRIYVVVLKEENEKYYAFADAIRTGENLVEFVRRYNAEIVHLCESRKAAEDLAIIWNRSFKYNNTYYLSSEE